MISFTSVQSIIGKQRFRWRFRLPRKFKIPFKLRDNIVILLLESGTIGKLGGHVGDLATAIDIAVRAHSGQFDKSGVPYVLHCIRVMSQLNDATERIVAVLHDVLEDTAITATELRAAQFSEQVVEAVESLTRRQGEAYCGLIVRAQTNPIARIVKMADLRDNFNLPRTQFGIDSFAADLNRLARYVIAYQFLEGRLSEKEYYEMAAKVEATLNINSASR